MGLVIPIIATAANLAMVGAVVAQIKASMGKGPESVKNATSLRDAREEAVKFSKSDPSGYAEKFGKMSPENAAKYIYLGKMQDNPKAKPLIEKLKVDTKGATSEGLAAEEVASTDGEMKLKEEKTPSTIKGAGSKFLRGAGHFGQVAFAGLMAKEIIDMMGHGGSAPAEYAAEDNNFQADFNGDNISSSDVYKRRQARATGMGDTLNLQESQRPTMPMSGIGTDLQSIIAGNEGLLQQISQQRQPTSITEAYARQGFSPPKPDNFDFRNLLQ
jgi:hypothetical protein